MRKTSWLALACALLVAVSAAAQEQRGAIEGVVKDASGLVLPGVTIEGRSPRLIGVATAVTEANGSFRLPALSPGMYEVTATLSGFNSAKVANVEVLLGQIKKVELTLSVAGVSETVQVTGESALIDTTQSASVNNIRSEELQSLPRGRDFTSLVAIIPGTADEKKAAGISVDGASGAENRYVIDGIDTTSIQTGVSAKGLVTDVIEEVQVKSSGYNAEYGGSTGGVFNVITKSGSNRFRGDVGAYYTGSALEGPVRPTLRLSPINSDASEYITYAKDRVTRAEPEVTLGGPVLKDRIWFFASYIPYFESVRRPVTFVKSGQTVSFDQKNRGFYSANNLTAQLAKNTRLKFAFNPAQTPRKGLLPVQAGTDDQVGAQSYFGRIDRDQPNTSYSGNLSWVPTSSLLLSVRSGYLRTNINDRTPINQYRHSFSTSNMTTARIPEAFRRPTGFSDVPQAGHQITQWDIQSRFSVNTDVTYYGSFGGTHTLKAGVQYDRTGNNVKSGMITPTVTLRWGRSRTTSDGRVVNGEYGTYSVNLRSVTGDVHQDAAALFLQDSWTIGQRLTLNIGLRSEYETVPTYDTSHGEADPAITFGFGQKLAPRLGFAWSVNNKWKAYGSWGTFFDQTKLELGRLSFGGTKSPTWYYTLDTYDWPSINCAGPSGSGCPGSYIEYYDGYLPSNLPDHNLIDPSIRPFKSWEVTLGLDHELNSSTSVGFRYVHKQVSTAIEDLGVNVPGVGEDYFISNPGFGIAKYTLGPDFPAQPKAKRHYDGFEVKLNHRLTNNLAASGSYLLSRLWGNYPGLASSDENGRASPNQLSIFDSLVSSFDANRQPVYGVLGTDRPHQVKAQAIYVLPFGTTVGGSFYAASGRPVSRQLSVVSGSVFYAGRMSDGRLPMYSQINLYVEHEFKLAANRAVQLSINVMNLFDQRTATDRFNVETQNSLPITDEEFFQGPAPNIQQAIAANGTPRDPRFLLDSDYQLPRAIRLALKFVF